SASTSLTSRNKAAHRSRRSICSVSFICSSFSSGLYSAILLTDRDSRSFYGERERCHSGTRPIRRDNWRFGDAHEWAEANHTHRARLWRIERVSLSSVYLFSSLSILTSRNKKSRLRELAFGSGSKYVPH